MKMRIFLGLLGVGLSAWADPASGIPKVTDVVMTQAVERLVTITYRLTDAPAIVTLDIQTNATDGTWASIGGTNIWSLSGDVNRKVSGKETYTITWRPDFSWQGNLANVRAVVTAWSVDNTPNYMVVDISAGARQNTQRYYQSA